MRLWKNLFVTLCFLFVYQIESMAQYGFDTTTVYFEINEREIRSGQGTVLDSVARTALSEDRKLLIFGYADYLGTHTPNQALSDARAEEVKAYLLGQGLPGDYIIQSSGVGQNPTQRIGEHGNRDYRKVDIFLKKKAPQDTGMVFYIPDTPPTDYNSAPGKSKSTAVVISDDRISPVAEAMLKSEVGGTFVLKDLHFYMTRSTLKPESYPVLRDLKEVMQAYESLIIKLEGHVCCLSNPGDSYDLDKRNFTLSSNRAFAVFRFLVESGIAEERISFEGFGFSRPLHRQELTDQQMQENRRVEVRIISR